MSFKSVRTVLAAIALVVLFTYVALPYTAYADDPKGYQVMAENERLALLVNSETSEIAVRDKASGEIWYSNPPGAKKEKEQLSIVYYDPEDKQKKMDNYNNAIKFGQFEVAEIENGVAISYTLGQEWKEDDYVPVAISQDRFQSEILDRITDPKDQALVLKQYELLELKRLPESSTSPAGGLGPDKLWGKYDLVSPTRTLKASEKPPLISLLLDRYVNLRDDIDARADVKEEDMSQMVDNPTYILKARVAPWDKTDMVNLFKEIGYLPEDVGVDQEAYHIPAPVKNVETFGLTIEYTLEGDSLIVTVPMDKVRYPKDVVPQLAYVKGANSAFQGQVGRGNIYQYFDEIGGSLVTFPLYSVSVLPYFGAADKARQGYLFVPDGSGALIDIGKQNDLAYLKRVYGGDGGVPQTITTIDPAPIVSTQGVYMPVFGLKRDDSAFLAVIESGASYAEISGQVAGSVNSYSSVSTRYTLMPFSKITLATTARSQRGGGKSINVYAERLPNEDIRIRYAFLNGESANYVGMAKYYQEYLRDRGFLKETTTKGNVPFFLDLIGAVEKQQSIMGIPFTVAVPLTTFDEAKEIVGQLSAAGVKNTVVQYYGWLDGGLNQAFPNAAKVGGALGGLKGLTGLRDYLEQNGAEFFPSVNFLWMSAKASSSVNLRTEATKMSNGDPVPYVLSPSRLGSTISGFLKDYSGYGINGLSLGDMGSMVSSDFAPGRMIDRDEAIETVRDQLKRLRDDAKLDLMVSGANVYALPYAKYVIDMPLEGTDYRVVTESVPFMQIVTHGYYTYAGAPLNLSDNMDKAILKSIEVGASPHFLWFYREPSILKDTAYNGFFSSYYKDWLSRSVIIYQEVSGVLSKVQDQQIVDHRRIGDEVYETTYENGVSVIVNYGTRPFEFGGIRVDGESYRVIEEGQNSAN